MFELDYLPQSKLKYPRSVSNLIGNSLAFVIEQLSHNNKSILVVTKTNQQANELKTLLLYLKVNTHLIPDYDTLPYDNFSPNNLVIAERISSLIKLLNKEQGVYIVSSQVAIQRFTPKKYLAQQICLNINEDHQLSDVLKYITDAGYIKVDTVYEQGEYRQIGNSLEFFPLGHPNPYKLTFVDQLEKIRPIVDGVPSKTQESLTISLTSEYPTNHIAIRKFIKRYREYFNLSNSELNGIDNLLEQNVKVQGLHYYLPLFFENTNSLFDYLDDKFLIVYDMDINEHLDKIYHELTSKYLQRKNNQYRPPIKLTDLYLLPNDFNYIRKKFISYAFTTKEVDHNQNTVFPTIPLPDIKLDIKSNVGMDKLIYLLKNNNEDYFVISVHSVGRRESIIDIFINHEIEIVLIDDIKDAKPNVLNLIISPFNSGFTLQQKTNNFYFITELDLFGKHKTYNRIEKINQEQIFDSLNDLKVDQIIIHKQFGLAVYKGLTTINLDGTDSDFLELKYADGKLFLPVHDLDLISKHSDGNQEKVPKLSSLNKTATWEKTREKAFEKIKDVAAELLQAQANRESTKGIEFKLDPKDYQEFVDHFNFTETADQQTAIEHILEDMQSQTKMDRLICGDVGFGKTEVAQRAVFTAISNNKQVAILVPTTLLADQHFNNFKDRFAYMNCNIELLSRFRTAKEIKQVQADLEKGLVDIVIGTHILLSPKIKFKNLGLLVVDEEHQFGVTHKEKIKQLRSEIDILTMTATPIPRTLNMAISGLRDLSIIQTPPESRLEIKTFLINETDDVAQIAIEREINRGGQVFYVHNQVSNIEHIAQELQDLLPEARIAIAHGQMPESDLENVMLNFSNQRYNILVCTTIIETGIDIPNANTIIINRADKFGLAQLHQLRGRVGRSHNQAYAYLVVPNKKHLNHEAKSRLNAICEFSSLGAGYLLATRDLEIRGAGNILGKEQSGHADRIGFNLYIEMLDNVVKQFKQGKEILNFDDLVSKKIDLKLNFPLIIPENYIFDASTRLSYYKQFSSASNLQQLDRIKIQLIDNFGSLPPSVVAMFKVHQLQIIYQDSGITKIEGNERQVKIYFKEQNKLNVDAALALFKQNPLMYKIGSNTITLSNDFGNPLNLLNELHAILKNIF